MNTDRLFQLGNFFLFMTVVNCAVLLMFSRNPQLYWITAVLGLAGAALHIVGEVLVRKHDKEINDADSEQRPEGQ